MTHPLPPNKKEKITAAQNPSHDKSLPIEKRLADFLGKYHILLNGVNAHEPFYLKYEGKPNVRCDDDEKQRIIEFVNLLLSQAKQKEKEICICSAIKFTNGKIYRGHRHGDCYWTAMMSGIDVKREIGEQGFVTSNNRFVGRTEGRKLQDAAGIKSVDTEGYRGNTLFSEDLY
jgi:hypothetical protein